MYCRYCGKNAVDMYEVPTTLVDSKRTSLVPSGPYSCLDCAIKKGFYCLIHRQLHSAYDFGIRHACNQCIERRAELLADYQREILNFYSDFWQNLKEEQLEFVLSEIGIDVNILNKLSQCSPERGEAYFFSFVPNLLTQMAVYLELYEVSFQEFLQWLENRSTNPLLASFLLCDYLEIGSSPDELFSTES